MVMYERPPGVEAERKTDRGAEKGAAAASFSPRSGNDIGGASPMGVVVGHDLVLAASARTCVNIASVAR